MKHLKFWVIILLGMGIFMGLSGNAQAHFGMIIPSTEIVTQTQGGEIALTVMFAHPFERNWMDMGRPIRFGARIRGSKIENLLPLLKPIKIRGHQAADASPCKTGSQKGLLL